MPGSGYEVVVVGAGIVGAAVAEALALDGHQVTVVDRGCAAGEATSAGMGHIVVMDDSEPQIALTAYSQQLWDRRASSLPPGSERVECGTIWIAADDQEMAEASRKAEFYHGRGIRAELLNSAELAKAEPQLRNALAGGLVVPGDSVIYPPPVVASMLETVRGRNGRILLGSIVCSLSGREVQLADGTRLRCDYAVNAAGSNAGLLSSNLQLRPRKGHLVITDRYPGFIRHQLVELGYLKSAHRSSGTSVAFNIQPRATGQLLIGSSRQFDDETKDVNYEVLSQMLARAVEYVPTIKSLHALRVWTGFRAATPDKLPLIGPHPMDPRLILATGHEGLGITTSLGSARLIADYLAGRKSSIPHEPYLPSRWNEEEK